MAKLLLILASGRRRRGDGVNFTDFYARRTPSTRHPRRRWRYPSARPSPLKIVAPTASDDPARRYDYIGRKDPVTGEITCPWRKGRGKVQSGGSSGVQMAG